MISAKGKQSIHSIQSALDKYAFFSSAEYVNLYLRP